MANFLNLQRRAKAIKPSQVRRDLFKYIKKIEKLFIDSNIKQLEESKNAKGGLLTNKDSRFTGVYSEKTQELAALDGLTKTAGDPYNFLWSGEFLKGFQLFKKGESTLEIFSTETGGGDKAAFFDGYKDLFGITEDNLKRIKDSDLQPFMSFYYRKKLGI